MYENSHRVFLTVKSAPSDDNIRLGLGGVHSLKTGFLPSTIFQISIVYQVTGSILSLVVPVLMLLWLSLFPFPMI